MKAERQDIRDFDLKQLEALLAEAGHPPYRARQMFSWMYERAASTFEEMTNLPAELRGSLAERFRIAPAALAAAAQVSEDGTHKFALRLADQAVIETVLIPMPNKFRTLCLSTQVGCRYGCRFCASGMGGFERNLTCGEIVEQLLFFRRSQPDTTVSHVVFMGVGEPLDNYEATLAAARRINAPEGLGVAARRITLSTCGLVPEIRRLAGEGLQLELSVSLHGATDAARDKLMPVNKRYPVGDVVAACRDYTSATGRIVTFEYILIDGINASDRDAGALSRLLDGSKSRVNLIRCNRVEELGCDGVNTTRAQTFAARLRRHGVSVTVRAPKGRDIDAACGQLRWKLGGGAGDRR